MSVELAKKHLIDCTAIEFDPAVVKLFFEILETAAIKTAELPSHEISVEPVAI